MARSSTFSFARHSPTPSLTRHCLCEGVGFACACCYWSLLWLLWLWLTVVVVVLICVMMMPPGKRFALPGGVAARGWRTVGLQMRMMAAAMVVNIVGVVVWWFGLVLMLWLVVGARMLIAVAGVRSSAVGSVAWRSFVTRTALSYDGSMRYQRKAMPGSSKL
jgi:hypothetical protein